MCYKPDVFQSLVPSPASPSSPNTCQKCRFFGFTSDLLNQKPQGADSCCFSKSLDVTGGRELNFMTLSLEDSFRGRIFWGSPSDVGLNNGNHMQKTLQSWPLSGVHIYLIKEFV